MVRQACAQNMSFKFPRLKPKHPQRSVFDGLPQFKWNISKIKKETGYGSYGVMKVGHYNQQDGQSQQVVVKVRRDIRSNEREFSKEVRHLNRVNGQTLCRL